MIRGEIRFQKPSRFVEEIPPELIETEDQLFEEERTVPVPNARQHARQAFQQQPFQSQAAGKGAKHFAVTKGKGLDYTVGDRVSHVKFGEGEVKNITEGGRDYEVTVDFDSAGVKKMFASFAKLQKL